ncbi:PKD domain-containing protein [Planomicrobium okeanokoites]|uniref:PKD domain-containing protein n=1 Tax=Planomicrobium okeanokoites TaxID=244 RepID=UPI0024919029|nr:PKD domain-containing protein [Planomicrobium okeanokoites]
MNKWKIAFATALIMITIVILTRGPTVAEAASSPYDVPTSIISGWDSNYGSKTYDMETGKRLTYDIYSSKFTSGGYSIVNKNFGKGTQPYVRFQGWAVIAGHRHHTSTNHDTYIVAEDVSNMNNVKIYGALPYGNLSASEDIEYNKAQSTSTTIWNKCSSTTRNVSNLTCNMQYDNVGFDAYIPLDELFPSASKSESYRLYIVKDVAGHKVYTSLNVPFDFSKLKHNGGDISLSSGVNARTLQMTSYPVIRRTYARSGEGGSQRGYFTQGNNYTAVTQEESQTAIWFGVRSPHDNNYTRWASSAYWSFGGEQARLSFVPENNPPVHISHSMSSTYRNGNDYWVQPGTAVNVNLRQRDAESGNRGQYLRLDGSGQDVRSVHWFSGTTTNIAPVNSSFAGTSSLDISSASRTESTSYGRANWTVTPKTHAHSYDVLYYYNDLAGNSIGYGDTGMNLRADGVAPTHLSSSITGAPYVNGTTYWVKSNDSLTVTTRQSDPHSGNKSMYMRVLDNDYSEETWQGNQVTRNRHDFNSTTTANNVQLTNPAFTVNSAYRTENSTYGTIQWGVTPRNHGKKYVVQRFYVDNVNNDSGTYSTIGTIQVDDVAPTVAYRNTADTANFTSNSPTNKSNVSVRLKFADADSGYQQSRYGWSKSATVAPTSWSSWQSSSNYLATLNSSGGYYLHVQAQDKVGNYNNSVNGLYYAYMNNAPVANITYSPSPVYNDSTVTLRSNASDPDGDPITYQWAYQEPGSSTWVNFSTAVNPVKNFAIKGNWNIRLTVADAWNSTTVTEVLPVENRAPAPAFNWNPSTIYNNTTVSFVNGSTDADKDSLSYQWAYRAPGSSTWVNFSTAVNPSRVFNQKGTWQVRLTVNDGTTSSSVSKALTVGNRAPVADFNWNPATIYNDTSVTFSNAASDIDGDSLTYQWAYQEPNSATWTNFSTTANPSRVLNIKGNWKIRLTVSDGAANHAVTKNLTVSNRAPVSDFSWNPTTIYNDTNVTLTNSASDVDKDSLTYQWAYQEPNSTAWVNFSTAANPSKVFGKKGIWNVRLTVSDGALSHAVTKSLTVRNRAPVANFNWNPTTIYNNTNVTLNNISSDVDNDALTYQWAYQEPNSTAWVNFSTAVNPSKVFDKKGTWNVRLIANDGTATHSVIKSLTVQNRAPVANFNWNPTQIYNDTNLVFTNISTDADKDSLTYQWAYQAPGSSVWVNFSTATNPSRVFNSKGTWNIRLIANDGTVSDSVTKAITISNRAPVTDFGWNPSSVYTNTNVTFTNNSTDADKDTLTYEWSYQEPGSTTWTDFSTEETPSDVFDQKGNWNIRLITSDGETSTALTKVLTVLNTPPVVTLNYSPANIFEGDTVTLTAVPTDLDGDQMTVVFEENQGGVWQEMHKLENVSPGATVTHSFVADPKTYQIRVRAIDDSNGVGTAAVSFVANPLEIRGVVNHTADWEAIHAEAGHLPDQFYSGERFLTEAIVTDHPIEKVTVSFAGQQITGNLLTLLLPMVERAHPVYEVEVYESITGNPDEHLAPGMAYFVFEAKWQNGVIKQHKVGVNIVSDVYGAFDFYRSN